MAGLLVTVLLPAPSLCADTAGEVVAEDASALPTAQPPSHRFSLPPVYIPSAAPDDPASTGLYLQNPEMNPFTGALGYRIPIVTPPGRNGIAPNLALTYNSQARNGWLGIGWTLDMGAIQRSTKFGVDYGNNRDGYPFVAAINGAASDLVYSKDPASPWYGCYQSVVEGAFSKYCFINGTSWIVTAKDGTKYFYGSSDASRQDDLGSGDGLIPWVWIGDYNGDGLMDIASWHSQQDMSMNLSTGSGFASSIWKGVFRAPLYTRIGDFNGDGKTDIAAMASAGGKSVAVNLSTGSQFTTKQWHADLDFYGRFYAGDFNGDGKTDLISFETGDTATLHLSAHPPPDLLRTVTNGIGATTTIAYTPSSVYANTVLPFVVQTVGSITVDDGNGVSSMTEYRYRHGLHVHGDREFYGFGYAIGKNPAGTLTQTWFNQREATGVPNRFKGLVLAQRTSTPLGAEPEKRWIPDRLYTYTKNFYSFTGNGPVFPYLEQKDDYLCDGTSQEGPCRQTRTELGYDGYGNVTTKKTKQCRDGQCSSYVDERREYTLYSDGNEPCNKTAWIVNRPLTTAITDGNDTVMAQTWFEYDAGTCDKGNLTKKTLWLNTEANPANYPATRYQYDAYGRVTRVTDPKGNAVTTTYETIANTFPATQTIDTLNFTTTTTYTYACGAPATVTDPNGAVTTYRYDSFCRPTKVILPGDTEAAPTRSYSYVDFGGVGVQRVTTFVKAPSVADADYTVFSESYFDGLGRPIATRKTGPPEESAIVTGTRYNTIGLVSWKTLPYYEGNQPTGSTGFTYDAAGRVKTISNPDAGVSTITYFQGRTETVDPLRHMTAKTADIYGRLIRVEEYAGQGSYALYATTDYFYDTLGNLVRVEDGAKVNGADRPNVTTMVYDSLSRKIRMTDPDTCHSQDPNVCFWEYRYDGNGNLTFQKDAMGQIIMFSYYNGAIGRDDPLNRIMVKDYRVTETDPYAQPPYETDIVYTYDTGTYGKGRLANVTHAAGSKAFTYDVRGRPIETVRTIDGVRYTVLNTYDAADRITSITYPNNSVVAYAYDDGGNLFTVTQDGQPRATYTFYNEVGRPRQMDLGNGTITTYAYDPLTFRVNAIAAAGLQGLAYGYDLAGNVLSITDGIAPSRSRTFTYDHRNRLMTAAGSSYSTPTPPYDSIDYAYDEIGNMTFNERVGTGVYTYPDPGSAHPHAVSNAGGIAYTYTANGNLTSSTNGRTISWYYDNKPRRISVSGGSTVDYTYDHAGQRIKKVVGSSWTRYIGNLYECTSAGCTAYTFANGRRISKQAGTAVTYYHQDHLGSTAAMSDALGNPVGDYAYYPYGETLSTSGMEKYRFTDQEYDSEHGLYNYNAREYDPVIGRFISPDAIVPDPADPQTLNRYSYCRNNPVMYVDPSGHFSIDEALMSFASGFAGGVTFVLTGGNFIAAGMVAGAVSGAMTGRGENVLGGAAIGGATGALGGFVAWNFGAVGMYTMMAAGAGVAYAQGGLDGLAYYGAGELVQ